MSAHESSVVVSTENAQLLTEAVKDVIDARRVLTSKLVRLEDILAALGIDPRRPLDTQTQEGFVAPPASP